MDESQLIESLSPIERNLLPSINKNFSSIKDLVKEAELDETTTRRASSLLENKGLVITKSSNKKKVILGILGVNYLKKELPERILVNKLSEKKSLLIGEIKSACNLNDNEAKIALGTLKKKNVVEISNGKVVLLGSKDLSKKMQEELFLEMLPRDLDSLSSEENHTFELLKKRKDIVEIEEKGDLKVKLTELGEKISKMSLKSDLIESLTPKMIKQNSWKGKKFRRYDLASPVPRLFGGKRHFVEQSKDYARDIWTEMGFKEMDGRMVDTGFWVFDSLFTAQDHPVREMQDTFYLKNLNGKIPERMKNSKDCVVFKVQKAHEGGIDNSLGWQYAWNEDDAKRVVLRTHTTNLSVRTLRKIAEKKEFPAKYFALGKCFRNETVDWSHGFEFHQTEGIVVDENANFRQLIGYLTQFYQKMGYPKIRVRPGYFAYTEPSLEIDVYHPTRKEWVELGGAGMFRPEVTIPMFGKHIPVLAWGQGFDRIITEYFGIKDLRELYKNDITKLRETKAWRKL